MSRYAQKLIGTLNPETPLEVRITSDHIQTPNLLREDYGWMGKGFEILVKNPYLHSLFRKTSGVVVTQTGVFGLEGCIHEGDQEVLEVLLYQQFQRSLRVHELAGNQELENYDSVSLGVVKGVVLGGCIGGLFTGLDAAGVPYTNSIPAEVLSRAGPGLAEAVAIEHEVHSKIRSDGTSSRFISLVREAFFEDVPQIIKKTPFAFYQALNVGGLLDSLCGKNKVRVAKEESPTQTWAEAQVAAPVRGLLALALLKTLDHYTPLFRSSGMHALYSGLEALSVFWVNTGNNVEGSIAVYSTLRDKARAAGDPHPRLTGFKHAARDYFQAANYIVCSSWYLGELAMRSYGIRLEELGGMIGAGLESALLSCDTAVAGQVAKGIAYGALIVPARYSVRTTHLAHLAHTFSAEGLSCALRKTPLGRYAMKRNM